MRVINVVVIKDGVVDNIDSFGISKKQLSGKVAKKAEELFEEKIRELGFDESGDFASLNTYIESGFFYVPNSGMASSVCLTWSDI